MLWNPLTSSPCVSLDLLTMEISAVDLHLGNMVFKFNQVYQLSSMKICGLLHYLKVKPKM
jgi:hypothetical protein